MTNPTLVLRPSETQTVRLRIHHRGRLVQHPVKLYVGGVASEMNWDWDVDLMSYMEIEKMIKNEGYCNIRCLWYWNPKYAFSRGLRPLNDDKDVLKFMEDIRGYKLIDVYVEHKVEEVNIEDVRFEEVNVEEAIVEDENVEEANGEDENVEDVNVEGVNREDSETDPDYEECEDDEDGEESEESEDEELNLGHDVGVNWTTVLPNTSTEQPSRLVVNSDNECCDSDELHTPLGSDVEDGMERFPSFKQTTKFEIGMMFKDKMQIKDAVKDYAMESNKNVVIKKNDKKRVVVKCMVGCPFYIRFSLRTTNQFWQLVSFTNLHNCHRTPRNRQATTVWLAKKFVNTLRHTPEMKTKGLIAEAVEKWGVKLSVDQAYRAKKKAIELIQGAGREQFIHLRSYAEELLKSNPNSTVKIQCDDSACGPVFERIYVCLEACKSAFATTCRPLIGLDACFLKGDFGGQLVGAVGKDGNNKMIPIAYAVVEAETKDSWQWFLKLLLEDLRSIQKNAYGFISDQQKGLVPAILETSQHVEHRLCVKHLYGNWRKKYPGIHMKEVLWRAARATTLPAWERAMNQMKEFNAKAWKDMMDVPASCWSRSHFKTDSQCDLQVNNMCEAFNREILEYRDKPIITLLEGIKHYITVRISTQKEKLSRYKGAISPNIQQILEKTKREAERWTATWHSDDDFAIFGVSNSVETYIVNLLQKTCACRKWDLTGIPCCHAIACIRFNKKEPEDYVSSFYRKSTVMATYSHIIMPTNGPQLWPTNVTQPINPPVMRRSIGRPKKNRNKANDEPRNRKTLPRSLQTFKCKKCGSFGHNKRTCKGKRAAERAIPKGGNKKAKKNRKQRG
ncbi:uncharacterized protein LOC131596807 [Vicia villosa]|uniref:uncharacterized protein LOC131596807 n=1 Tax=Vicia villosa TaxID=3911 RepID=UPI00273A906A|nr:uncharacterized protein LOC131596807 [Vicia villosa]